jgi:hypothetical protein
VISVKVRVEDLQVIRHDVRLSWMFGQGGIVLDLVRVYPFPRVKVFEVLINLVDVRG